MDVVKQGFSQRVQVHTLCKQGPPSLDDLGWCVIILEHTVKGVSVSAYGRSVSKEISGELGLDKASCGLGNSPGEGDGDGGAMIGGRGLCCRPEREEEVGDFLQEEKVVKGASNLVRCLKGGSSGPGVDQDVIEPARVLKACMCELVIGVGPVRPRVSGVESCCVAGLLVYVVSELPSSSV